MNPSFAWPSTDDHTGLSYQRSMIRFSDIEAGTSNVYFVGEKYINPDHYESGNDAADNEHAFVGYDNDIFRVTNWPPQRDRRGYGNTRVFGSAHPGGFGVVYADGSVHPKYLDSTTLVSTFRVRLHLLTAGLMMAIPPTPASRALRTKPARVALRTSRVQDRVTPVPADSNSDWLCCLLTMCRVMCTN